MAECVQCGYCCTKCACGFGEYDTERRRCKYLTEDNLCSKFEEIQKDPSSVFSPAFGAGCCMPLFNDVRANKIRERRIRNEK